MDCWFENTQTMAHWWCLVAVEALHTLPATFFLYFLNSLSLRMFIWDFGLSKYQWMLHYIEDKSDGSLPFVYEQLWRSRHGMHQDHQQLLPQHFSFHSFWQDTINICWSQTLSLKGVFRFRANFSLAVYFCSLRCLLWSSYFLFWDFLSCHHFGEKVLRHPHQRRRIVSWVRFVSYLWSLKVLFTFSQGQNMFWLISTCLYGIYIIQQLSSLIG